MNIDYAALAKCIDKSLVIHREEDYVYLLYPEPQKSGNILFQERGEVFVVWCNEYRLKDMKTVFGIIKEHVPYDVLFPYIDTKEEYDIVLCMGGEAINFEDEDADCARGISKEFGSLIVRNHREL